MRRLIAATAATAAIAAPLALAGPAHADTNSLNCSGASNVSGSLVVTLEPGDPDRLRVTINLSDGGARGWDWKMKHNGDVSAQGAKTDSFSVTRVMLNGFGTDTIKGVVDNGARTIHCEATINFSG